jgi:DNA end-binding protein Ku
MAAPRALWKGFLKLESINCAVKLIGASSESGKLHFKTLSRKSKLPVKSEYRDEKTGETVGHDEQVKGYELDGGTFLTIEPDEIEALKTGATHLLEIDGFVDEASVSPLYLEKPYHLVPADDLATEAYTLVAKAMARNKVAALGRIVMQQRQRSVLVEPRDRGMVVTLLRQANEVVDAADVFGGIENAKVEPELLEIATMLINRKPAHFDPSKFEDRYEDALIEMVQAKIKGKKLPTKMPPPPKSNVVDLASLLRDSLQKEGGANPPAKPAAKKSKVA